MSKKIGVHFEVKGRRNYDEIRRIASNMIPSDKWNAWTRERKYGIIVDIGVNLQNFRLELQSREIDFTEENF